jgi:hypothetical protein
MTFYEEIPITNAINSRFLEGAVDICIKIRPTERRRDHLGVCFIRKHFKMAKNC